MHTGTYTRDVLTMDLLQPLPSLSKVDSGGQSGADRAAPAWALADQVNHGGWFPAHRPGARRATPAASKAG
ncbi:YpsA SLOG family protein [Aquincola sp. J276]|uniref:YpsA SLOG family protein n=1 Tax=Aquincola sp. J276 TaxID=2898432 RepID=UPI0038575A72